MRLIRFCIIVLFYWTLNPTILSQNKSNFNRLTVKINGSYIKVTQVIEDHFKTIWMLGGKQLFKYDGYSYMPVSLKSVFKESPTSDKIEKIIKDSEGRIWLYTSKGIMARQTIGDQFKIINSNKFGKEHLFNVKTMVSYKNHILFVDYDGDIHKLNIKNNKIEKVLSTSNLAIEEIICTTSNNCFIRTEDNEVFAFSIQKKELHKLNKSFNHFPEKIAFTVDKDNYLWIATWGRGIFRYKFEKDHFIENYSYSEVLEKASKNVFISIFCDSFNNLYLGTDGNGLYKLSLNSLKLEHF